MVLRHAKMKVATLIGFALVCMAIFVYLFQAAGGQIGFGSQYTVNAIIPQTFNLVPNSDVRAAGAKIGYVNSVIPDGQNARVQFTIDTHTASFPPIYKNATVEVRIKTLVGESYLSLTPGTRSAGAVRNGGTLPASQNLTTVPLEKVLGMLDPATRAAVQKEMQGLGLGLNGHGAQLNNLFGALLPTVNNGNTLFGVLNPERQQVQQLIDDTGRVMQALSTRTAQYQGLIADAKATAVAVASRDSQFRQTLDVLPSTLAQARSTVSQLNGLSVRATPVFSNLRVASYDLSPAISQLEPTASAARVFFRQLKPFLHNFKPLVTQLTPAANVLKSIVLPLAAVLRQGDPALAYLTNYAREFGSFFSNVNGFVDTKDKLGYRGRVFPIVSYNDYTGLTTTERNLLDAFIKAGSLGLLDGTKMNPYPQPGTAGTPTAANNFQRITATP
jgi:phospholipid/cholesterol/gamma-HCH transport system substrate-binding protein